MNNLFLEEKKKKNLRTCQLKQLTILEEIDRICKRHDIPYWLDGGTLLGAVRHQGFIPWDDDIDIAMRAKDLQRFIRIAPAELSNELFLQTPESDPSHREPIIKIRNLNSLYIESGDDFSETYQKGLFVDIFPFVDYPDIPRSWVKHLAKGISVSYSVLHKAHYYSPRAFAEFFWFGFKYAACRTIWNILSFIRPKKTFISNIPINNGYGIMHRKDSLFPLGEIAFEGKMFSAPCNPDKYLKDLYKNYMNIPPEDKRRIHAVYIHPELIKR